MSNALITQDRERWLAALAGLLHDIGKFAQRAGVGTGKHAEIGGNIVGDLVPKLLRQGLYPVMAHHDQPLPDPRTRVVALADRLSAGERTPADHAQPQRLLSIFSRVTADGMRAPRDTYWPLRALALQEAVLFPTVGDAVDQGAGYAALWRGFAAELATLRDAHCDAADLPSYLESLQLLMQRYTWCVPSAFYRSVPDVSLFDHSRMTAALSACLLGQPDERIRALLSALRDWYHAGKDAQPPALLEQTDAALLVGGDISGVQDFIYTITSRGATSALRGRSFYLQLLTEVLTRFILQALDLPVTNLIYQGGGNFYLLAPPDALTQLDEAQRQISKMLLKHHHGELYVAISAHPLKIADFYGGRIATAWEHLAQQQQRAKQQRFSDLGAEIGEVFEPEGLGGDSKGQCQVCGREHTRTATHDSVRKCSPCEQFEKLGNQLRDARYLVIGADVDDKTERIEGTWQTVLADFGFAAQVDHAVPAAGSSRRVVYALDDDALRDLSPTPHTAIGRRFLVNVTPTITQKEIDTLRGEVDELPRAESVKPFSAMATQSRGIRRLGVLRMDVDNLGDLFANGLGDHASLSRVAGLSFAVSLFFEGWIAQLAREVSDWARDSARGDTLYSIYSGGDDLFFVGSWDVVVPLAQRIRADLAHFTGGHPGIHASAGIALIADKYPLYQAARDAGEAEHKAKALRWQDKNDTPRKKDALTFLDISLPWCRFGYDDSPEANTVSAICTKLAQHRAENVPHSVIRTLLSIYNAHREAAEARADAGTDVNMAGESQDLFGPWIWRGYYRLKREGEHYPVAEELAQSLHDDGQWFRDITWVGVAARWAELLTR